MMSAEERELTLARMNQAVSRFYSAAVQIGNHPFIEFAGVMTAYVKSCERAHADGVDFSECTAHAGEALPMESFELDYLAEKLNCVFGGRITTAPEPPAVDSGPLPGRQ